MNLKLLVASVVIPLGVGFLGAFFTAPAIYTWYATLSKPWFTPPDSVFGPAWTILYILMGISLYLVLLSRKKKDSALKFFALQLFLNFLWSYVFFGLHNIWLALFVIIVLFLTILQTIREFLKISKNAGYLLFPYILWVSFALILNLSIFLLNWQKSSVF